MIHSIKQVISFLFVLILFKVLSCTAEPKKLNKEDVNDLIKSTCSAELPNLDQEFKDAKYTQVRWDTKNIKKFDGYNPYIEKGVLQFKPDMTIGGNTPTNSEISRLSIPFYFPSLRGTQDSSYRKEKREFFKKFRVESKYRHGVPESLIPLSVLQVKDWKTLPITHEIVFFKNNFRPDLTQTEINQARKVYERYVVLIRSTNPDREIKYVSDYEQFGLKEFISKRHGLFYYEPIDNVNPSPYGLPRFACDAAGRIGITGCVGHFKMDSNYLVTYELPYKLMQCWEQVEEGVRRVVRLNTQATD